MNRELAIKLLKGQLAVACKSMAGAVKSDAYIKQSSISIYDRENGIIAVTPKCVEITYLDEKDVIVITPEGTPVECGRKLPDDIATHLEIYKSFPQIHSVAKLCTQPLMSFSYSKVATAIYDENSSITENMSKRKVNEDGFLVVPEKGLYVWNLKAFDLVYGIMSLNKYAGVFNQVCKDENIEKAIEIYNYTYNIYSSEEEENTGIVGCCVNSKEQQKINFEMLCYFDEVCRKNGINYSLTGGTLLGAVRHRGFIPWDDDADVFLARPEFDKLVDAFPDDHRFVFVTKEKDPTFPYVYGRLIDTHTLITTSPNTLSAGRGMFLDVCVVDGLPKSARARKRFAKTMRIYFRMRRATIHEKSSAAYARRGPLVRKAKDIICALTTTEFWNKKISKKMHKYDFDNCEWVGNFTSQYGMREMLHRSAFDSYLDIEFEGCQFMICEGYEEYLTNIYRKYMNLPAEKKRVGHHPNNCIYVK